MGNSRSQQTSVMSFYDDFNTPRKHNDVTTTISDDVDDESEVLSSRTKMLECPQCEEMASFQLMFYNKNSMCAACVDKVRRKIPIKKKTRVMNYGGKLMDARFPQAVDWNFGKEVAGEKTSAPKGSSTGGGGGGGKNNWAKIRGVMALTQRPRDMQLVDYQTTHTGLHLQVLKEQGGSTNRVYKEQPMPLTKRGVLDKINQKHGVAEIDDGEVSRHNACTVVNQPVVIFF